MKLDKPTAIARRNQALERPVLNRDNTLLAIPTANATCGGSMCRRRYCAKASPTGSTCCCTPRDR